MADSVSVVKGSITTVDDPNALDVKLSIWATEITMRADGSELGNWPTGAVVIRPIDALSFEFIAEGDRLIFAPDNPDEFAEHPIVTGGSVSKKRKRSRAAKKKVVNEAPILRWDETTDTETQRRKDRADRGRRDGEAQLSKSKKKPPKPSRAEKRASKVVEDGVAAEPPVEPSRTEKRAAKAVQKAGAAERPVKPSRAEKRASKVSEDEDAVQRPAKPSRAERRAAKSAESPEATARAAAAPIEVPAVPTPERRPNRAQWMGQFGRVETPAEVAPEAQPSAASADSSSSAVEAAPERDSWRHRTWIRAIDFARQYDLFGLDRVPISPSQREDPNHSHTWNHRVAPTGGPGKYLCTICGAIRRDSRSGANQSS